MPKLFINLLLIFYGFFISSPKALEKVTIQMLLEKGIVVIETYPEKAPKTVKRITELIEQGFYDGLTFHRVISGFMAQGGDPSGTGMGNPGYKFNDEFHVDLRHNSEGILSMANSGANSNGSQFFITLQAVPVSYTHLTLPTKRIV